jgi:hypothetical protein
VLIRTRQNIDKCGNIYVGNSDDTVPETGLVKDKVVRGYAAICSYSFEYWRFIFTCVYKFAEIVRKMTWRKDVKKVKSSNKLC